jgi:hypothetical protein
MPRETSAAYLVKTVNYKLKLTEGAKTINIFMAVIDFEV